MCTIHASHPRPRSSAAVASVARRAWRSLHGAAHGVASCARSRRRHEGDEAVGARVPHRTRRSQRPPRHRVSPRFPRRRPRLPRRAVEVVAARPRRHRHDHRSMAPLRIRRSAVIKKKKKKAKKPAKRGRVVRAENVAALRVREIDSIRDEIEKKKKELVPRWNANPEDVQKSVAQLVLALVE